jgi:hypothetical protein
MNEKIKYWYYITQRNMGRYILHEDRYYRIVGFRYLPNGRKGFIVTGNSSYDFQDIEKMCISKILLNMKDKLKYHYYFIPFPLDTGYTLVNDKK